MLPDFVVWLILGLVIAIPIGLGIFNSHRKAEEQKRLEEERIDFIIQHKHMSAEEIILLKDLDNYNKIQLLMVVHGYNVNEASHLLKTAEKEEQRAKLKSVKRKVSQKLNEQYNDIPVHDRQPISDDVKTFVWQRDRGKCVKCSGNEKLEFDHVIPFSKGGSNTERNLQLLCEKCNREKSNII